MERVTYFVDVLLPLPLPGLFTYRIPNDFPGELEFGMRVVVPFGKSKLYSALVVEVHTNVPARHQVKYIIDIVDQQPVITGKQYRLWQWLSRYYMCTLGEVMAVALPSALKLASETQLMLHPLYDGDLSSLTSKEMRIVEVLSSRQAITIAETSQIAGQQKVIPLIKTLVEKKVVLTDEEIRDPYIPKKELWISLDQAYATEERFSALLDELSKSKKTAKQADLLLVLFLLIKASHKEVDGQVDFSKAVSKRELLNRANLPASRLQTLIKKRILVEKEVTVSRLNDYVSRDQVKDITLSPSQDIAYRDIKQQFEQYPTLLLHGVTGSGKTEIYIKMIDEVLARGKQVLYLLPEIALTSQIVNRLRQYFGHKVGVYHSRFNEYERVEIWNKVLHHAGEAGDDQYRLILGTRSALLLPFQNLGLIVVDEEHDTSYKQNDPAPRYHARDSAIVLGQIHEAKVLLGTATPSIESYYNARNHKYGLVELTERFSGSTLPEIWIVDIIESIKQKKMRDHFSQFLLENIEDALQKGEQVIIFQNRRGFSLRLFCNTCHTMPVCRHCDVTLTYHKKNNLLKCHYCGYAVEVPETCPACQSRDIEMKGFGTEKIEDVLKERLPEARVVRMDLDTTRSKSAYQQIIADFEQHKTDILVGTQMVTKGLDFDRVSVVGILNADNLITFPDFRSFERAFQVMAQVSGRAGRKEIPGKVIIQTYNPSHQALQYVLSNDYKAMYENQLTERRQFHYPPFSRLIKITLKEKSEELVNEASLVLAPLLKEAFPGQVLGPEFPIVPRIQNFYMKDFWIKMKKDDKLENHKSHLQQIIDRFKANTAYKKVRVVVNIDPS